MLSHTVTYEDFDENNVTETLWFHITKTDLAGNLNLIEELEAIQSVLEGPKRDLTLLEVKSILDLVKTFAKLSYGVRSEDGKRFRKNEATWQEFTETAAYDAFMMTLFEDPQKAMDFLVGVIPKDLREQAIQELTPEQRAEVAPHIPKARVQITDTPKTPQPSAEELMAAYEREQAAKGQTSGG